MDSISALRALQKQHNREHAILESNKGTEKRRLFWPQFQELTHSHQIFENELDIRQKECLDLSFKPLSLLAIIPGPAKEFRNLRIASVIPEKAVDKLDRSYQMEIYGIHENDVTRLVKKDYKMVKRYHPNAIEMSEFHVVDFHLKRYVKQPQLKLAKIVLMHRCQKV